MICSRCGTRLPIGSKKCHFCGSEIPSDTETNFVNKFTALFTFWAIFLSVFFLFYTINSEIQLFPSKIENAMMSLVDGIVITGGYWLLSSKMIEFVINPQKMIPTNKNLWYITIFFMIYAITIYALYVSSLINYPLIFGFVSIFLIIVLILFVYWFLNNQN
jgi:hypothetical protein